MSKERPILISAPMVHALLDGSKTQTRRIVKPDLNPNGSWKKKGWFGVEMCPYGTTGDHLWVKETFKPTFMDGSGTIYRASIPYGNLDCHFKPWKPSIFMTRARSRITLEITEVRVERLNDISEEDAIAEGTTPSIVGSDLDGLKYRAGYQTLWESINGPGSWALNPFCWCITFKIITK